MNQPGTIGHTRPACLILSTSAVITLLWAGPLFAGQLEQRSGKAVFRLEAEHVEGNAVMLRLSDLLRVTLSVDGGPDLEVQGIRRLVASPDWTEKSRSPPKKVRSADGSYHWQQSFELDPM